MFDGDVWLTNKPDVMENGLRLSHAGSVSDLTYTGLLSDGSTSEDDCRGWMDASRSGRSGNAEDTDKSWIDGQLFLFVSSSLAVDFVVIVICMHVCSLPHRW